MTYHYRGVTTVAMIPALFVISHLVLASVANPFHKYPYVFLLDVGNEELEKTNTEQIRLSVPGGSLAIRYPAAGYGDTIGHIRVSGIDFGTDLKSSIVEGGPGYRYVVLIFDGNKGVPYDAVVTVQTVPDDTLSLQNINTKDVSTDSNSYKVDENSEDISEDENNSAEDLNDSNTSETQYNEKSNLGMIQITSEALDYAKNEVDDDFNDADNTKDIHKQYIENPNLYSQVNKETNSKNAYSNLNVKQKQNDQALNEADENDEDDRLIDEIDEQNDKSGGKTDENGEKSKVISDEDDDDDELNNPNEMIYVNGNRGDNYKDFENQNEKPVQDDPIAIGHMLNGQDVHNNYRKYRDPNNNNSFDSDDSSAVAY